MPSTKTRLSASDLEGKAWHTSLEYFADLDLMLLDQQHLGWNHRSCLHEPAGSLEQYHARLLRGR